MQPESLASNNCPDVAAFFDERTSSLQYVVSDPATKTCAIIDPVLDFDEGSGSISARNLDTILAHVEDQGLRVAWILDTHAHADHLSAAFALKERTGAPMGIGARIVEVQRFWRPIYGMPDPSGEPTFWDSLLDDGHTFNVGGIEGRVMASPGHTPASVTYLIGDAAFVHDTLFMPDGGTARADFPGGSARQLWQSIEAILALPEATRVFTGHDYRPGGREPRWQSSVGEQKRDNVHVMGQSEASFIAMREARDKTLPLPKLMLYALQVNIRGGRLPEPEPGGRRYLKVPLNAFATAPTPV